MNEQLQKALAALIENLSSAITSVGGKIADQVPELVNQMIGFQIAKYYIWIGFEAFLLIVIPILICWAIGLLQKRKTAHEEALKEERERFREDSETGAGWVCAILGIIWVLSGISIVSDIIQIVKLYNFPLVWILDYLTNLTAK